MGHSPYEAATVQIIWGGIEQGVTHGSLTLRGCHCSGVIGGGIEQV